MVKRVLGFAGILLIVTAALFAAGGEESGERSEPVTLSLYMPGPGTQDDEEMVESALSECSVPLINADMDVNFVGWGEWFDKKRLMIAS
jgi:ABC-type glycerol-3-phosphate transport system substrate-binding protein